MNNILHKRKSIRLKAYDYSQPGGYFVTICTKDRENLFGEISDGKMIQNEYATILRRCWEDLPHHYPNIELDAFVVMPNHVHGIVIILDDFPVGEGLKPSPTSTKRYSLTEIVRAFKTFSARRINEMRNTPGTPIWQRNYFEHIIRNESSLNRIREYIVTNAERWEFDQENNVRTDQSEFKGCLTSTGHNPIMKRQNK